MERRSRLVISLLLTYASVANAGLFITSPYDGVTCSGGSSCQVTWADDGNTPLLSEIGSCDIALYEGTNTLVQQLASGLDVAQTLQLTFTPNPAAGPDASDYFIQVTSLSAKSENDSSQAYTAFSGFFTLDDMSGTAGEPVASLTSSLASSSNTAASSGSQSTSSFSTNGVVSTTTLPDTATTAASALSSALSAISSAATGSLSSGSKTSSATSGSHSSSGSATGSAAQSSSNSSASSTSRTIPFATAFFSIGLFTAFFL